MVYFKSYCCIIYAVVAPSFIFEIKDSPNVSSLQEDLETRIAYRHCILKAGIELHPAILNGVVLTYSSLLPTGP